jgi:NAD(P)-dependent dehydrogenase (short-subunit alcohol dehydrogenase family)
VKPLDLHGKTAVVTGAASGIGRATALALARAGADLFICDINEPALHAPAAEARALGRSVEVRLVDVSSKEQVRALADDVNKTAGSADILVNNAGVGVGGLFLDTPLENWEWVVSINLWGVVYGCHFFLPAMVKRARGGHIVNIASLAGLIPTPSLSAYAATKFAVVGLSESLRVELVPHRIGVTVVCPGFIDTNIGHASRLTGENLDESGARERMAGILKRRGYGPHKVANEILRGIADDRAVLPVTPEAWAFYLLNRLSPSLTFAIARSLTRTMERIARGTPR